MSGEKTELVDITALVKEAAASLTVVDTMIAPESFSLQDSMAALELMDPIMDCCEIPLAQIAPLGPDGKPTVSEEDARRVFPRPAPMGLDDKVDPLPWNELTNDDAAAILLECLIRLQAFLTGASVVESTFTCLYAHTPVVRDMKEYLDDQKGTIPQRAVYAATLMLLEVTDVIRGIVLNADIYEEEDFTASMYGIDYFKETESTAVPTAQAVLKDLQKLESSPAIQIIELALAFPLDLLSVCVTMAKLAGKDVVKQVEHAQTTARMGRATLDRLKLVHTSWENSQSKPDSTRIVVHKAFNSFVNRPLMGNAPVRKFTFDDIDVATTSLAQISHELDTKLCHAMLKGDTFGKIRRILSTISSQSVNILTRSLLVLDLYFDEKLFGQHSLVDKIVQHLQQLAKMPVAVFENKTVTAFLGRLAKPMYDLLKLQLLNSNRQRAYLEAVMFGDWAALSPEGRVVDLALRNDSNLGPDTPPYFSIYILYTTAGLMDHFVALGIELQLFCGHDELSMAYWYRDFLLSAVINQIGTLRQSKAEALQQAAAAAAAAAAPAPAKKGGKKKGGKAKKSSGNSAQPKQHVPTAEDMDDAFDFLVVNVKQVLSRGIVRFLACTKQAGLIPETPLQFTSKKRIFEKRFEALGLIQQPPLLEYSDFLSGSDFSKVSAEDLVASAGECFDAAKLYVEKLLVQWKSTDEDFRTMSEEDLRSLTKVCFGNGIYLQKLKKSPEGKVTFDTTSHKEFCTIKIG
eukprot:Nitzschia sp. Nitz4//scaffold182_size44100//14566//16872//NITZ4_007251-RA/size44100-augustus-gene-0.19-mRNA-1//1//CDS//3329539556//1702//frame0